MVIEHRDIRQFGEKVVNLPSEHAKRYREQVNDLRCRLESHIKDNPDFHLKRMMLSGSLAKHTALKSINDADAAVYVDSAKAPADFDEFLSWLTNELAHLYKHIGQDQIQKQTYSITIKLEGLDVDVVPVYYLDSDWNGELVSQDDGSRIKTNIPQHIEFINKRKQDNPGHFVQVVRLLKYWAKRKKDENSNFRFKSFMIELIMAYLADKEKIKKAELADYPVALRKFFDYLQTSGLDDTIWFSDYYRSEPARSSAPIHIYDPVNSENNIADQYTDENKNLILENALEAADAIEYASCATTESEALRMWQKVLGASFSK